jgi:hypothetical protein
MTGVGAMTALGYDLAKDARLVMVFDLTAALRQLDTAIAKAANPDPELPQKTPREILRAHMRRQGEDGNG